MIDNFDVKMLSVLQENCKLSVAELADRVGLSTSACWRRFKALEDSGVIKNQVAVLDQKKVGLNATAFVHISLINHTEESINRFMSFVEMQDSIVDCASITGDADFLLKVVAMDAENLEHFMMKELLPTGLVRSASTNFVLRQIKQQSKLPLPS